MNEGDIEHADIVSALTFLEARQRLDSPHAAGEATSRLIVELRSKFGLGNGGIEKLESNEGEGPQEPADWEAEDIDDELDQVKTDWAERLKLDALLSEEEQIELARQIEAGVIAQAVLVDDWRVPGSWKASELEALIEHGAAAFQR